MPLTAGTRLGTYEIIAPLGVGGMGEVYRARDARLGRDVALKVLPAELSANANRLSRLEREARVLAALNHPNIVVLHSIEEAGGIRFLTMELVEGASLDRRIASGSLSVASIVDLAIALAEALAAAHEKGVVHRDLKPANVVVTVNGHLKVLDFGLATRAPMESSLQSSGASTLAASLSEAGMLVGTVPYMAPEQLVGDAVDGGTDVFALGAVVYELTCGSRAFPGRTMAEVSASILHNEPAPLHTVRHDCPPDLERIVAHCLRKRRRERPSAHEVAGELRALRRSLDHDRPGPAAAEPSSPAHPAVAVLPFRDLQRRPENADLGLALADATITELTLLRSLIVRPTSAILRYHESGVDPQTAASELSVDAVVEGSFQRAGNRLRVTVQLVSCADGRPRWGTKIDTSLEDVFRMQDEVSRRIAAALDVQLSPGEDLRLTDAARRVAPAGDAYAEYMGGKRHLYRGTLQGVNAAIEHFERARAIDPRFAAAWAGLGDAYLRMAFEHAPDGDWQPRAQELCDRALSLDPELPEGHYLRGRLAWTPAAGFDHARAMRGSIGALASRPGLIEARYLLGLVLFHIGLLDESNQEFDRVLALDPQDLYAGAHRGSIRLHQGRFDEAFAIAEHAVNRVPASWSLSLLAQSQARLGRLEDAARAAERLARESPEYSEVHSLTGLIAALRGDADGARQGIARTIANPRAFGHYHHAQYDVACIHASLGDGEAAVEWLTQSARNGYPCQPFFAIDPLLRPLHGHAAYASLMHDLDAECAGYRKLYEALRQDGSD